MNKVLKELLSTGIYLLIVLLAVWLVITFVGQRTMVEGASMEPSLYDNNQLIVDKISYVLGDPERFDIIVFPFDDGSEQGAYYIKRIIGMPGETVQIDEKGNIYIDGEKLEENYGKEIIESDNLGRAEEPVKLGEDEYFVMGDNRNNSMDSRFETVGNIRRKDIIGRAWFRIWPFSEFGFVSHK